MTNFSEDKEAEIAKNIISSYYQNHFEKFGGSYVIILSYNCNFRCPYCFERKIQNKGINHIGKVISAETIKDLYKFIEKNPPKTNCITIYGGEPLINENKEALQYLLKNISQKYKLKIISNGYETDNFFDILDKNNTSLIQISCDGNRENHNITRKSINGESTFDKIMNNIKVLIDKQITVNLRINCTPKNISDLAEMHKELQLYSFYTSDLFTISYAPVIDFSANLQKNEIEMQNFVNTVLEFNKNSNTNNFIEGFYIHNHLRNVFNDALSKKQPIKIQPVACNSYVNTFVLDPFGKIYPCWDVTDDAEHCTGTYYPEITENKAVLDKWHKRETTIFNKCIRCP